VNGPVWQRNYYDRVIRNEVELDRFREYIAFNPTAWQFDHENSQWENNAEYERTWSWIERGRAGFEGL
jgi:hypothetical protein